MNAKQTMIALRAMKSNPKLRLTETGVPGVQPGAS
jgi:hypothetical protein